MFPPKKRQNANLSKDKIDLNHDLHQKDEVQWISNEKDRVEREEFRYLQSIIMAKGINTIDINKKIKVNSI